jgi:hypothetical protein
MRSAAFTHIFSPKRQVRHGHSLACLGCRPRIAAFNQHGLRPFLCFNARQGATTLATRDFAQHKTKALPIVKASYHDQRCLHEEPQAPLAGPIARLGPRTAPWALEDGAGCLTWQQTTGLPANPARLWINVTPGEPSRPVPSFYHWLRLNLTRVRILHLDRHARRNESLEYYTRSVVADARGYAM